MIRYIRNIRSISIKSMVIIVEALLLVLVSVSLSELDELLTI
jgi:hypothetical protein